MSQPVDLYDGDEIRLGSVVLRVRIEGQKIDDEAALRKQSDLIFPLGREVLTVGCAPTCSICLDHPTTSRRHTEIQPADGAFVVRDLPWIRWS